MRLEITADVGEAIAGYLRSGRPEADCRSVFLRCYAPRRGLSVPAVSGIVYDACNRAGIARISAHRLRHYVDGWVMWLAAASPLVAEPRVLVPAT